MDSVRWIRSHNPKDRGFPTARKPYYECAGCGYVVRDASHACPRCRGDNFKLHSVLLPTDDAGKIISDPSDRRVART